MATAPTQAESAASLPSLELLHAIIEDISDELELVPLLNRIIAHGCRLTGADDGGIGLYNPSRDSVRIIASRNLPIPALNQEMAAGAGLPGRVLKTGKPFIARYNELDDVVVPDPADKCVIGLPIRWRGELIGIFGVGIVPPGWFTQADVDTLSLLARHAAIAIHNADCYAEQRERTIRFALLARVAGIVNAGLDLDTMLQRAADAIHDVLEFPNVDIALLDPEDANTLIVHTRGGDFRDAIEGMDTLPVDSSIMGAAVRQRLTQRVNDVRRDPRYTLTLALAVPGAQVAVPIMSGERMLGVLSVEGPSPFGDLDVSSLEIIADHLAVAITNAYLIEQARQHAVEIDRQRLAYDLHDSVTQSVASINLLAQSLPLAWRRDAVEGERRARRLQDLAHAASVEMRELLAELHPDARTTDTRNEQAATPAAPRPKHSLAHVVSQQCRKLVPEGTTLLTECGGWIAQQPALEEALCKVCNEAVSNAARHAHASCIEVRVDVHSESASLSVSDDGCGLSVDAICHAGLGLRSMRERIEALGGSVELRTRNPHGTTMLARLPRRDAD